MGVATRFEDLIVWQLAVRLRDGVYAFTDKGRASTDCKFRDQVRDSASSAPRNIAEGFLRFDPPEFAQFLKIAKGSPGETLRAANRLHAYLRQCGRKKPQRGASK